MYQSEDKELWEKIGRDSDRKAYDQLYLRYFSALVGYSELFLPHPEAEDVVQKVLLSLWEKRYSLQIRGTVSSYLFIATRNACLDLLKHGAVHQRAMSDLRLSIIDNAADWNRYQFDELMILLRKSLSELPEEQRICFEMNRFQDKTYREIARELGISEKTVEYRISQVLKKLQVDLADYLPLLPILVSSLFRSVN
jgi:RNA polymerase sigma-70 factor (ECF subfamily)